MKTKRGVRVPTVWVVTAMIAGLALAPAAWGQTTASWTNTAGGSYSWNVNGNWDPATFPNGQDHVAYLTNNIAGNQTVDLGQAITVGQLYVGDANSTHRFTITNTTANALTFQASGGNALLVKRGINVQPTSSGGDTIAAHITLASDLTISNTVPRTATDQRLTLSGNITESGGARKITFSTVSWEGFVLSGSNSFSGGIKLALGNDQAVEVQNANALGSGPVTSTVGCLQFNLSAPATFTNDMQLLSGNGRTLVNLSTNAVTLNGALAGGGNAYFWLYGPNGNGGFVLGGNNTSGSRLFTDNTSATIANSAAVNSFNFAILTENNGRTGRLYLANGVAMTKGVNYNQWGVISNSTPVYLGMSEAGAASISGIVDLNYYNNSGSTAVSDFHLETPAGATLTLSGQIKNSNTYANNRLVKIGAGTVAITNSNTYGGPTIVSNGTLWVNNTGGSGTGTGSVSVATNGILGGVGSITGAVSVAAGGTLAPGTNSVGTLTVGALTLSSNSTFAVQLNGTNTASYSRCVVTTGAVNLADSRLSVTVTGGYLPKVNDSFTIIRNTPGNAVSGRFANDSSIRAPGVAGAFEVSYAGGAGQDVVLRFVGVRGTVICVK